MKQTVTFRRTEIMTLEIEVLQPLAKVTLEQQVNGQGTLGAPEWAKMTRHERTAWATTSINPACECTQPGKSKKGKR